MYHRARALVTDSNYKSDKLVYFDATYILKSQFSKKGAWGLAVTYIVDLHCINLSLLAALHRQRSIKD